MSSDPRAAAAKAVARVIAQGESLNQALPAYLDQVTPRDRGLYRELCFGTLRHYHLLQGIVAQLLDKPLKNKDADIQALLLIGIYQLHTLRIPDHAAVSSTVNASKILKKPWSKGLVNALLRRFTREQDTLLAALTTPQRQSHPAWLVEAIQQQWPRQLDDIVAVNNSHPPMTLRVNGDREAYAGTLAEQGIAFTTGQLSPAAIQLSEPMDVDAIPGFAAGAVSVQDEAAQLAALLLQAQPGDKVLDACSAPGGKTCHILQSQPQLAELVAVDIDETRLLRVNENLQREQLHARTVCADASALQTLYSHGYFDRIVVDAPCSATGVIRRHPDIKVLRQKADIARFAKTQLDILQAVWPLLKSGGRLLYVTCSILPQENSAVVKRFLADQAGAAEVDLQLSWGEACEHGRQLLPTLNGPDGLYYAAIDKL